MAEENRVFAPINIPLERRMQTGAIAMWLMMLPTSCGLLFTTLIALAYAVTNGDLISAALVAGAIGGYVYYLTVDRRWTKDGARWHFLVDSWIYRRFSALYTGYFPHRVFFDGFEEDADVDKIQKAQFPTDENYLFCCHPHGLYGLGVWSTFMLHNEKNSFFHKFVFGPKRLFDLTIHTLDMNFRLPLWREFVMAIGLTSVGKKTLLHRVSKERSVKGKKVKNTGQMSVLVPGGAAESIECTTNTLAIKKRKGFVRVAFETGATLVPVFTFGERKLFKPLVKNEGTARKVMKSFQKLFGFAMPLVIGRGVFNYHVGFAPRRAELTTVIGKPISVPSGPFTDKDVDRVHAEYIEAVKALYKKHKDKYDPDSPDAELPVV